MILREMMLESLQGMALPVQGGTAVAVQDKAGDRKPAFGDVLKSTVRAKESGGSDVKGIGSEGNGDRKEIKTFGELRSKIAREDKKAHAGAKLEDGDDTLNGRKKTAPGGKAGGVAAEEMVNAFAQVLGMNPDEFGKLLQAAGISPEELTTMTDLRQLSDRLAAALGLNEEQSGALKEIFDMVKVQLETRSDIPETDPDPTVPADAVKAAGSAEDAAGTAEKTGGAPVIEIVKAPEDPKAELAEIIARMKLKLDEIRDRLHNGREALAEEISQKLEALLKDMGRPMAGEPEAGPADGAKAAETVGTGKTVAAADDGMDRAQNNAGNDGAGSGENKGGRADKAERADAKPATETAAPAVNDDGGGLTAMAAGQVQKAGEAVQADRLYGRTPVQAKEIINQVIEKARVILTGDKSEMIMDLKPDSLGKLSLKVVTEHGIVMAKFIAENQQVKQVLESNMQLLKDSLEKQGMNVQGFSVSVRQDGRQGYESRNGTGAPDRASRRRTAFGTERLSAAIERIAAAERHNPYSISTSTVNFTA